MNRVGQPLLTGPREPDLNPGTSGRIPPPRRDPFPGDVLVMDPWCLVPYYTTALVGALLRRDLQVRLASPAYDLDPGCYGRNGIPVDSGLLDLVGRRRIASRGLRQALKFGEGCINLLAYGARFGVRAPRIVHIHQVRLLQEGFSLELKLLRWARRRGARVIHTVHNLLPHDSGTKHAACFRRFYHAMDGLICHSEEIRERLIAEFGVEANRIWVIPHGPLFDDRSLPRSEARARLGLAPERPVALCQGIIRPYKGLPFLLEAWERVQSVNPEALLVIAGQGEASQMEEIRRIVKDRRLDNSVALELEFLSVPRLLEWYAAADVVVYPYREITTSGALMTGVAQEKAIAATRLPYFERVLTEGSDGLMTPYGDAEGLSASLLRVLGDPLLRDRLAAGVAALRRRLYGWDRIAERTEEAYRDILLPHPAGPSPLTLQNDL